MSAEVANRYLQGRESLAIAIARGQVRCRGGSRAALPYLPAARLICEPYRRVVEAEFPDLARPRPSKRMPYSALTRGFGRRRLCAERWQQATSGPRRREPPGDWGPATRLARRPGADGRRSGPSARKATGPNRPRRLM